MSVENKLAIYRDRLKAEGHSDLTIGHRLANKRRELAPDYTNHKAKGQAERKAAWLRRMEAKGKVNVG